MLPPDGLSDFADTIHGRRPLVLRRDPSLLPGYRFTGLDGVSSQSAGPESPPHQQREIVAKLIQEGQAIVDRLQQMLDNLRRLGE